MTILITLRRIGPYHHARFVAAVNRGIDLIPSFFKAIDNNPIVTCSPEVKTKSLSAEYCESKFISKMPSKRVTCFEESFVEKAQFK